METVDEEQGHPGKLPLVYYGPQYPTAEETVSELVEYERSLKDQRMIQNAKHQTLRRTAIGMRQFWEGFTENNGLEKASRENRVIYVLRELKEAGIITPRSIHNRLPSTPDGLPEKERLIAKRIIAKHI